MIENFIEIFKWVIIAMASIELMNNVENWLQAKLNIN